MKILNRQYWENNLRWGENGRESIDYGTLLTTLASPNMLLVWGIDVSHWNPPPVNFKRMKEMFNMQFVILKGCDGSLEAKYYKENKAAVKAAGLPFGTYVWLYPNSKVSIDAQVNAWWKMYSADKGALGLFIDCEWTNYGGKPANPMTADLKMAHDKWRAKSGEHATTYTSVGYSSVYLKGFDWSTYPELWAANYNVSKPSLPAGAKDYDFWQFTSMLDGKTLDPNGNAELDGNYFNGTAEEFAVRYNLSTPIPPEGDDDMISETMWNELLKRLDNIEAAIKGNDGSGGGTTPPPVIEKESDYNVVEKDANINGLVVAYKTPDINETNVDRFPVKPPQVVTAINDWKDVPAGLVGWSGMSDIDKQNTYREWVCLHEKQIKQANGKWREFPDIFLQNGTVRAEYCWMLRSCLGSKV